MPLGSTRLRFSRCSPKRQSGLRIVSAPSDTAILNMAVDSQSMFRRRVPRLVPSGENSAADKVFRDLLSEANRDLANLLRDVRTESSGIELGDERSRQVSDLLMRAVRCAAKQYMLQAELGSLALTDELTGLYNRRGFMAMAERQFKLGRRSGRGMLLFVMDVDGLKTINDSFGHYQGDCALKRTAAILGETFRDSDVAARLGGDEFAVLAIEAAGHCEATIKARLLECLRSIPPEQSPYDISLSFGIARFDPRDRMSIGEMLARADHAMYEQKRRRSSAIVEMEPSLQTQ
jgi:diguanylate cyclase (GGDEF)-like protein